MPFIFFYIRCNRTPVFVLPFDIRQSVSALSICNIRKNTIQMIIMFIIITLLSGLTCFSQVVSTLSFHSKRMLGNFLYHVRKVNNYVFECQGYRFILPVGLWNCSDSVVFFVFHSISLSNIFELFRQCFSPLSWLVLYFLQIILYLCILSDNIILFTFFIPCCGVCVRFSVRMYSHLFCRVHVLFVICFVF